jgi:hypothetical protein
MGYVVRVREVRQVEVPAQPEVLGLRRGPALTKEERVISELPPASWERLLHFRVSLPQARGAGPCGTLVKAAGVRSSLAWSIAFLVEPLAAYYATYEPPMRFGAKPGPRGRRAA